MDKNMTTKWKAHKVVSWVVAATLLMQGSTWALSEKKECLRPRSFQEASQELKKPWADRQDALMAAAALLLTVPAPLVRQIEETANISLSIPAEKIAQEVELAGARFEGADDKAAHLDDLRVVAFFEHLEKISHHKVFAEGSFSLVPTADKRVVVVQSRWRGQGPYPDRTALITVNLSADTVRGVEVSIDGKERKMDLLPWQAHIEEPWWLEDKHCGFHGPVFSQRRRNDMGVGDHRSQEIGAAVIYRQGGDMSLELPSGFINYPPDPSPYASISLMSNEAVLSAPIDELFSAREIAELSEEFIHEMARSLYENNEALLKGVPINPYLVPTWLSLFPQDVPSNKDELLFIKSEPDFLNKNKWDVQEIERRLREAVGRIQGDKRINYAIVYPYKKFFLHQHFERAYKEYETHPDAAQARDFNAYCEQEKSWLDTDAVFYALFQAHYGKPWWLWEGPYQDKNSEEVKRFAAERAEEIAFYKYMQWLYDRRDEKVYRMYQDMGAKRIVDSPLYDANGGARSWAMQHLRDRRYSAGAPADEACPEMQTWDFWVYRLGSRRDECLEDFKQRIRRMLRHADGIRIDHIWGLFNEFYTEREDGVGKWVGAGFFPANDEEAVALGRVILTALAEVALERNALIIGENVGIRSDAIKAEFKRLQKVLPNLYGYGVLGHYRQEDINPETTLDLGDTHDTAATLEDRLQLPDFTAEHWRQYQDTLRAYGKGYDGLPSFAFCAQRGLEVLQQTRMYMLSWQNPVGDRGPEARINIPNSIVGVWGYRWSRTVEEMLDIQPLGYFPLRGGRSVSLSAAIKDLAQARLSSMANLSSI